MATWKDPKVPVDPRSLYWHYPLDHPHFLGGRSSAAIRHGDWKLIEFFDTGESELFSLADDPSERGNVAADHPDVVASLKSKLAAWRESVEARTPSPPLLVEPRQLTFADHFSTGQVSGRWFFNGDWEAREGSLCRDQTGTATTRIFARELEYGDTLIRFDFRLQGAQDIRFISGSDGSYNAIVHIHPDHFRIETAQDKSGPFFQHWHGECAYDFAPERWYTMTVEFLGDRLVAHIDHTHVAYAQHPILEKTRGYFAFQVDNGPASFDNVQVFTAGKHSGLAENLRLIESVADNHPVQWPLEIQLRIAQTNAHDRLYQTDENYRALVERVEALDAKNEKAFPAVFRSHKEIRHEIDQLRRKLLREDPRYKELLFATHRATRAIESFLLAQNPEVTELPDSRRKRGLEQLRVKFQKDTRYVDLVQRQTAAQSQLEQTYPQLFVTDEQINANRKRHREELRGNADFREATDVRAAAWRAQQEHLMSHDQRVIELLDRMKSTTSDRSR